MARPRSRFVCQECGAVSVKWSGRCSDCSAWNSLVEELEPARRGSLSPNQGSSPAKPIALADVEVSEHRRVSSGVGEFDRVAGGGMVPGSLLLVGGPPGIGKSTLLLQVAEGVGSAGGRVLYVTGEESLGQVRMRADRLGVHTSHLRLLAETDLDSLVAHALAERPCLLLVDSIQTLSLAEVSSAPGSVSQVRECTARLMRLAKGEGITVILVGHVTKDGNLAGPRVLEHLVDAVLYFEGDDSHSYRLLKAVKNRFGPTHEVGLFEMHGVGLVDVPNASEFFLAQRQKGISGSCVVPLIEGTRALLVEVQSLCNKSYYGIPSRRASGLEVNRLVMLLAVLQKRGRLYTLGGQDVFVNVTGGMEIDETAADLGVLVAIASSATNTCVAEATAAFGEVGLGGELRAVAHAEQRIVECARMGIRHIVLPKTNLGSRASFKVPSGVTLSGVSLLAEALEEILPGFAQKARNLSKDSESEREARGEQGGFQAQDRPSTAPW
jgi:DNA repair protein RadA/Sms